MAEFGPQATELSAPQGAGANPIQGVQTSSYTPDLAPVASLFQKGAAMYEDWQKAKAKEGDQTILSGFANEMGSAEQQYLQDQDSNKYMVKRGLIINKYRTMAPGLTTEFSKMMGLSKEGIGGMAEDEATATRKRRQSILTAATDAGIPQPRGKEAEDAIIDAMQTSRRIKAQQKEEFETLQRGAQMSGWEREQIAADRKEKAASNLVLLSGKHSQAFGQQMRSLAKAVASGQMTPEDATAEADSYMNTIQMQINSIAVYDKDMAAPFKAEFDRMYSTMSPFFKKGADLEAMENQWKKLDLASKIRVLGNNAELHDLSTASQAFGNQPALYQGIHNSVSKFLLNKGAIEDGRVTPKAGADAQIIGDTKLEPQAYGVVKGGIKNFLDGGVDPKVKKNVRNEVFGQMKGVMEQYVDKFQLGKLTPESRKNMNEFLLDKDTARFLKENPLPTDVARGLAMAAEDNFKQFEQTFNVNVGEMLKGVDIRSAVQKMGGRGMGGQSQKPVRTDSVSAIDAVNISWQGDKLVFDPVSMPVDKIEQNRLLTQLNKVSDALSNGVKVAAHIQGETNYKAYFDQVKHKLFPSKFEAPVDSQDKTMKAATNGDYAVESNLRNLAANTPAEQSSGRSMEPPAAVNIKSIRQELEKATTKEQKDALWEALDYEMNRRKDSTSLGGKGLIEAGNIDLNSRPVVKNSDGSVSTVRSIGVNIDGVEVLIPTVSDDGKILSDKEAIDLYRRTGRHLGKFDSPQASDEYAKKLHKQQESRYAR